MPFVEGQTANFPAFDHDFRCFIVSAIICHSQHRLGFLRSDAISEQKWNAKLLRLHGKQKWQGTQGYSSQSLSNMHNAPKITGLIITWITWITWITTHIDSHGLLKVRDQEPNSLGLRTRWGTATSRITAATRRWRTYCPWSWRDAQQVKRVNDVWMMCEDVTMDTDLMNFFGDKLSSHSAVPQFDPEKYPTSMVSWSACWMLHAWVYCWAA